jgi:hypothetical protein
MCQLGERTAGRLALAVVAAEAHLAPNGRCPVGSGPRGNGGVEGDRFGTDGQPVVRASDGRTQLRHRAAVVGFVVRRAIDRREYVEVAVGAHDDERIGGPEASARQREIQSVGRCGRRNVDPALSADPTVRPSRRLVKSTRERRAGRPAPLCDPPKASIVSALLQLAATLRVVNPLLERTVRLPSGSGRE